LRITREHKLVKDQVTLCPTVWDGRYYAPEYGKDYKIKSLGKTGLLLCPDWRTTCRPRASLIASPSIWQGDDLISAPLANFGAKDVVQVVPTPWDL
jgi:tRNA(Ile)-lysidine synthase